VWARAITAVLLLAGGWFSARSGLGDVLGAWVVDLSAGVIAVSVLLGMRLPLDLWPRAPNREPFSITLALSVAFLLGLLVLLGGPIAGVFAEEGQYGAIVALVIGSVAITLATGRTKLEAFGRWFGIAVGCAVVPVAVGIIVLAFQGPAFSSFDIAPFLRGVSFFVALGFGASLVTQELAFRRLLIGQSGDAGLVAVLLAALLFGVWHAANPIETAGVLSALLSGTAGGLVAGSLYILSRSLLVPACYYGIRIGLLRGVDFGFGGGEGIATVVAVNGIVTGVLAVILAYFVVRRSGFFGALQLRPVVDAAGD